MRILYLNPCGQMGGAETSLRELLASIRSAKPEWELILVLGEDGPMAIRARELGVRVILLLYPDGFAKLGDNRQNPVRSFCSLAAATPSALRYAHRLRQIIRSNQPDIVHTNGFKMHLLGAWSCSPPVPLVWHIHDYVSTRPLMSRLLARHASRCSSAIVNSKSVAADLQKLAPGLAVTPLYNAVDLDRFSPNGTQIDLDACAGLDTAPPGVIRVGLVGTFANWKGHKTFLRALSLLPPGSAIRGYVIGGPIYQTSGSQWTLQELRDEAAELKLTGRIGFTGFIEDIPAAMRSLDIVVHASTKPEPFGMVIIEGMACGKAVIVSRGGGADELFEDGVDAAGHRAGDPANLAEQILRLATDKEYRSLLGAAGRSRAKRFFGRERLSSQLVAHYLKLAGKETKETLASGYGTDATRMNVGEKEHVSQV